MRTPGVHHCMVPNHIVIRVVSTESHSKWTHRTNVYTYNTRVERTNTVSWWQYCQCQILWPPHYTRRARGIEKEKLRTKAEQEQTLLYIYTGLKPSAQISNIIKRIRRNNMENSREIYPIGMIIYVCTCDVRKSNNDRNEDVSEFLPRTKM